MLNIKSKLFFLVIIPILSIFLILLFDGFILELFIGIAFFVTSFIFFIHKKEFDLFEPNIAFPIIYFFFYGIGSLYLFIREDDLATITLIYSFVGLLFYQLGTIFIKSDNKYILSDIKFTVNWDKKKMLLHLKVIALISFLAALFVFYKIGIPILSQDIFDVRHNRFSEVSHYSLFLLRNIGLVFHIYFINFFLNNDSCKSYKKLYILFLISFFLLASTAGRADLLFLLIPIVIYYHYTLRKISFKRVVLLGFGLISLTIGYNYYRLFKYSGEHETLIFLADITNGNPVLMFFYHLFAQISLVAKSFRDVIAYIPSQLNYFYGNIIPQTLSTYLPGHQLPPGEILKGFTDLEFAGGQANLTLLGDFYADFGILGLMVGMFFLGIGITLAYNYSMKKKTSSSLLIYGYFYYSLIVGLPGGLFSQSIRYYYLLIIIILLILSKKKFKE